MTAATGAAHNGAQWKDISLRALHWARERKYVGYNKHDGLNSPVLDTLSLNNRWLRLVAIQSVMRSPLHVRPALGVKKAANPKGYALFARAWLNMHQIQGDASSLAEATALLDRLLESANREYPGMSWGYGYPWQDLGFFAPTGFPNRIVTYFVSRALVHGYEVTGQQRYLDGAEQAVRFMLEAPKVLDEDAQSKCLSYVPRDDISMAVMDVSCLCAVVVAAVGKYKERPDLMQESRRLVNWVVDKQLDNGAWFYTYPAGDSHITHDNYHSGEIVDSLAEYAHYTGDVSFTDAYQKGLAFYREHLFTADWRPKWMSDRTYPHDAHGYSQGILSFCTAGQFDLAERVAGAAIEDIWNNREGRFAYQRWPLYTIKFTLMRWCQGWMSFAMSTLARGAN